MFLAEHLRAWASEQPDCHACADENRIWSVAALAAEVEDFAQALSYLGLRSLGLWVEDPCHVIAGMLAAAAAGVDCYLYHPDLPARLVDAVAQENGIVGLVSDQPDSVGGLGLWQLDGRGRIWVRNGAAVLVAEGMKSREPRLVVLTSGTTGLPKPVPHAWDRLAATVRRRPELEKVHWLSLYGMTRFAGLQVFLQAFLTRSLLVAPRERTPESILALLRKYSVTHAAGTPSSWRRVALSLPPGGDPNLHLVQLTLGGETASQSTLDLLRNRFPGVRVTHTYAATEVGVCFSASDGLEGYPLSELTGNPRGVECRIVDGKLYIRSRYARVDAESQWIDTGDQVRVDRDRFYILGRADGCINVGGSKVFPSEVEGVILGVPGVKEVRVSGRRSSVLGELVMAEVVTIEPADCAQMRKRILDACRLRLEPYKVPRLIEFRASLELNAAGKVDRRSG